MEQYPKVSFGVIVLNGEPFTRYCLRALYPFAHEILVVEGACEKAKHIATEDGHSIDGTLDILYDFKRTEDPENKIKVITKKGFWSEKDEQSQAYAEQVTGDYLWQIDIDEFYLPEHMDFILRLLKKHPEISTVSFKQLSFWGDTRYRCDSTYLLRGGDIFHRLFKFGCGYKYATHRPPTVVDENGIDLRRKGFLDANELASNNIYLYHYSTLFPKQVIEKVRYYQNLPFAQSKILPEWLENNFLKISDPFNVFIVPMFPGWLERYEGRHPDEIYRMMDEIRDGKLAVQTRDNRDVESFIDSLDYQKAIKTIKNEWAKDPSQELKLDHPIFDQPIFRQFKTEEKKLNVASFNTHQLTGGAAQIATTVSESLIKKGHRVTQYVKHQKLSRPWTVNIFDHQRDNQLWSICNRQGWLDYHIQSTFDILNNPDFQKHDLIHFHNLHGNYFNLFALALMARTKPCVWTLHDMQALTGHCAHSFECNKWMQGCGECPALHIEPSLMKDTSHQLWEDKKSVYEMIDLDIVVPSKWLKTKVEKSILAHQHIHVIPNGIDTHVFRDYDKQQCRKMLNLPQDKIIISFAAGGGLENPWKGGQYLDQVLRYLSGKYNNLLLLNIGGTQAETNGYSIVNTGYIDNKKALAMCYAASDIFAYPSLADSFGLVVLEAIACGLPVVAFKTGGIPEIIRDGVTGIMAPYKNLEKFVAKIESLIINPVLRQKMSLDAAESIAYEHSIEAMCKNYFNLYNDLLNEGKRVTDLSDGEFNEKLAQFSRKLRSIGNAPAADALLKHIQKNQVFEEQEINHKTVFDPVNEMSRQQYDVSIVLCTKNRAQLLDEMLISLKQAVDGISYEVIVIEGGSTDRTLEVLKKHNITKIYHESEHFAPGRHSWPKLYNFGFSKANGKWAMYASDDILFSRNCLSEAIRQLNKQSEKVAGGVFFYRNLHPTSAGWEKYGIDFAHGQKLLLNYGLVRLDYFKDVEGLDEQYQFYCADSDLCYKLYEKGYQLIPLSQCLITHNNLLDIQKQDNADQSGRDIELCHTKWSHFVSSKLPFPRRLFWQETLANAFRISCELDWINDGIETYWHGLALYQHRQFESAKIKFMEALKARLDHWQILWFIAQCAHKGGDEILARKGALSVIQLAPGFTEPLKLLVDQHQSKKAYAYSGTAAGDLSDNAPPVSSWSQNDLGGGQLTETVLNNLHHAGRTATSSIHNQFSISGQLRNKIRKFNKVIIWGLKSKRHTHSYIHRGFFDTFTKLEIPVFWVDDEIKYHEYVNKGDLIIGVDVAGEHLPVTDGVYYCLHNFSNQTHQQIEPSKNIRLQKYTDQAQTASDRWDEVTFFDKTSRTLYQPWATNLLGEEFSPPVIRPFTNIVFWIGSIWNDALNCGNVGEIERLKNVLKRRDIAFVHLRAISEDLNILYTRHSLISPAIAGQWQVKNNYLPCRMWKNISYGQLGFSNVSKFSEVFPDCVLIHEEIDVLIDSVLQMSPQRKREMILAQQQVVREKHTYVNRLLNIAKAFEAIEDI